MPLRALYCALTATIIAWPSTGSAQVGFSVELFGGGGTATMSGSARDVYDRAGGLGGGVGVGLGVGVVALRVRATAFYQATPGTLTGSIQEFSADRRIGGVRLDVPLPASIRGWTLMPSLSVTGSERRRVRVASQSDGSLTPTALSNEAISWRAASVRALLGVERTLGGRYAVRASIGPELTFNEDGRWTQLTARRPGVGTGVLAEIGLSARFGRKRA